MHFLLSGRRVVLLFVLMACLLPLVLAGPQSIPRVQPQSRVHDWSTQHVLYSRFGTMAALEAARRDPRAIFRWRETEQQRLTLQDAAQERSLLYFRRGHRPQPRPLGDFHADWNISLGTGASAFGQFPAKFSFDTTLAPSCTADFVVFPVNVNGSATQPNIVAFNNLYSGTGGGNTGICDGRSTPSGHSDTKTSPTVFWSYNVHALTAGAVPISPVLSLDGNEVAFVESAAGNPAHFHVLAWASGDGQTASLQNALVPKEVKTFTTTAPVEGSGTASDLAFGTTTDTLSSPYIDYADDTAYVGNDAGVLFRFKNVFCTTPLCGTSLPSLDTSWNGTGSVSVCSGKLTGPVQDFNTLNVFVGCSDGKVYGFNSAGKSLTIPSIAVGNGSATGGVVESPIVDGAGNGTNGFIYAVAGTGAAPNTGSAVLVQAHTDLSSVRIATIGGAGIFNQHAPAMNDAYFSSATSTNWVIYAAAYDATGANLVLYGATFDSSRNMATGTPTNTNSFGTIIAEYAPLTEFKNTNDWLFNAVLKGPTNMGRSNINTLTTFAAGVTNPAAGTIAASCTGITGMIVDNASTSNQASSFYFTCPGSNLAYKLTQAGFQ
jgi:hypothetical protein